MFQDIKRGKMKKSLIFLCSVLALAFILASFFISADVYGIDQIRLNRLEFGHVLYAENIYTVPAEIYPGANAVLKFDIVNTAQGFIRDVRIGLELPKEIAPYNDITKRKIAEMLSGDIDEVSFNIMVLPDTKEGVYKVPLSLQYINHVGEERTENDTISIVVGTTPKLLVEFKSSDIYEGNELGSIKVKIVNNDVSNIKFLTVQLKSSSDYEIISNDVEYIGDLNSDDFSEVSFRVKVIADSDQVVFPVELKYKDGLNRDYTQEAIVTLNILTAKELGIKTSSTWIIWVVVIIAIVGFIIYKRRSNNLIKQKKATLASNFKTKFG